MDFFRISDSGSSDDGRKKKKRNKKVKEKEKKKVVEKKKKGKEVKVGKSKSNGAVDKPGRVEKEGKKTKKKGKQKEDLAIQKEHEEKFRKLARLADYGDINDMQRDDDRGRNRSYEAQSSFDSRDGRGSGWNDRGSGREDSEDVGGRRNKSVREDKGRGKKGKKNRNMDNFDDDRDVRIERTFERLDMYEDKFERERERNIENLRFREEFQDYYQGREGNFRDDGFGRERDFRGPPRGGRDRGDIMDRFDRPLPVDDDRRRGRDRSADFGRRDDRRKRR